MANLEALLKKFDVTYEDQVKKYKDQGRGVCAALTAYTPEELAYASGLVPFVLWGFEIPLKTSKEYFPAFYSSVAQSTMEKALNGELDDLAFIMIPSLTDTLKATGQNWKRAITSVPTINIAYAQNRFIEPGVVFNEKQILKTKAKIEEITGKKIEDEKIEEAIKIYNANKAKLREFHDLVVDYPKTLCPSVRSKVITSAYLMDRKEHTELLDELIKAIKELPKEEFKGIKVVTSGVVGDISGMLDVLEENNIAVVGDNVLQESGMFRYDVKEGTGNPVKALAELISDIKGTSFLFDVDMTRIDIVKEEVKRTGAQGVILLLLKFCDTEEFDFPIFKRELSKDGTTVLEVEIDQQMTNYEQARTLVQTFVEMV